MATGTPRDVTFTSQNLNLSGLLYEPAGDGPHPAIVICHPITSVQQQSPANYAVKFAEAGFVTLTFDASYQGASEGEPRQLEDPWVRSEDIKNAVSYVTTLDNVDSGRIGGFGICGGGGYVTFAAQTDQRIKAVATASAANIGDMFRADPEGLAGQIKLSNDARTADAHAEATSGVPLLPGSQEEADQLPERGMLREAYDYYKTDRAQHPLAPGTLEPTSFDRLAQFDAWAFNSMISPRPLLMFAGSIADTRPHSETAVEKASEPRELVIVDDASHVDLYDKRVDDVAPKAIEFFTENL